VSPSNGNNTVLRSSFHLAPVHLRGVERLDYSLLPFRGLSHLVERIILLSMSALLSPVQDGKIWRVKIVWPNQTVHRFGQFTSEQDAIDWINAHPKLTRPEDTIDEPQHADQS
jgi:hypothetical protein